MNEASVPEQSILTYQAPKPKKPKNTTSRYLVLLLVAVLVGAGVYLWQKQEIKDVKNENARQAAEIEGLKIAAAAHGAEGEDSENNDTSPATGTNIENVKAAVS